MSELSDFLRSTRNKPFEWGKNDCCTLACGAVIAQKGYDPMEEYRGRYSTKIGAKRALTKFGHDSVTAAFDEKFERVPYAFARFGDLVQMDTGEMGVKTNRGVWVISFTGGTENYPDPKTVITAWRV